MFLLNGKSQEYDATLNVSEFYRIANHDVTSYTLNPSFPISNKFNGPLVPSFPSIIIPTLSQPNSDLLSLINDWQSWAKKISLAMKLDTLLFIYLAS